MIRAWLLIVLWGCLVVMTMLVGVPFDLGRYYLMVAQGELGLNSRGVFPLGHYIWMNWWGGWRAARHAMSDDPVFLRYAPGKEARV